MIVVCVAFKHGIWNSQRSFVTVQHVAVFTVLTATRDCAGNILPEGCEMIHTCVILQYWHTVDPHHKKLKASCIYICVQNKNCAGRKKTAFPINTILISVKGTVQRFNHSKRYKGGGWFRFTAPCTFKTNPAHSTKSLKCLYHSIESIRLKKFDNRCKTLWAQRGRGETNCNSITNTARQICIT